MTVVGGICHVIVTVGDGFDERWWTRNETKRERGDLVQGMQGAEVGDTGQTT